MKTLHVISVISNPLGWQSRRKLFDTFFTRLMQVSKDIPETADYNLQLHVVECLYGDQTPTLNRLRGPARFIGTYMAVHADDVLWNKENLINIGISRLPDDWEYVAWFDADIVFRSHTWLADTLDALQKYEVVQPWSYAIDLGPEDEPMMVHRSFALQSASKARASAKNNYTDWHTGYAWAARRSLIERTGGLFDKGVLGSADNHMAWSFIGNAARRFTQSWPAAYVQSVYDWEKLAFTGAVGVVPGTIEHLFHGSKKGRGYGWRWKLLKKHDFIPAEHTTYNQYGVLSFSKACPTGLKDDILQYFQGRAEDETTI